MIQLHLWQWAYNPAKFLFTLEGEVLFEDAPEFARQWKWVKTYLVYSALLRPIPRGFGLVLAARLESFPYNTVSIARENDLFNPRGIGAFFLADSSLLAQIRADAPTLFYEVDSAVPCANGETGNQAQYQARTA